MRAKILFLSILFICVLFVGMLSFCQLFQGQEEYNDTRKIFNQKYQEWLRHINSPEMLHMSIVGYDHQSMQDIVALGLPVVPIILETMNDSNRDKDSPTFLLQYALKKITKVQFNNILEHESTKNRYLTSYWEMWYRHSDRYTKMEFEILIASRRGFDHQQNPELLKEIDRRITNIGVFVLPYLIAEISNGEIGLIPIVSELSDKAVPADASAEACQFWWDKNKERYAKPNSQGHFDTFQTWQIGGNAIRVKFHSIEEDVVRLEKEDGAIIKVDYDKLPWNHKREVDRHRPKPIQAPDQVVETVEVKPVATEPKRTWTGVDGLYSMEAKYLSSDGERVTLERDDADRPIVRVKLSQLSVADQEYVKQRLAAENNQAKKQD